MQTGGKPVSIIQIVVVAYSILAALVLAFGPPIYWSYSTTITPKANRISCAKQLAVGHLIYASDHDNRLALADNWANATMPYIKNADIFRLSRPVRDTDNSAALNEATGGLDIDSISEQERTVLHFQSWKSAWNLAGGRELLWPYDRDDMNPVIVSVDCGAKFYSVESGAKLIWRPRLQSEDDPQ